MNLLAPGIAYSDALSTNMIAKNKTSDIVKAQEASNTNVMTNETLDASAKENLLSYLERTKSLQVLWFIQTISNQKIKFLII